MSQQKVTKAVIAAAGFGTRFLPQTKAMPKEMLPIIDKPVIQLVVEEVVAAGVTDVIIVTGPTKRAIEDHFDRALELEAELRQKGKARIADCLQAIAEQANFVYVRQKGLPKGNARPVLNAQHLIGDAPFFVFFGDDFFTGLTPRAKQLLDVYNQTGKSVISLLEVDTKDADKYGMVALGKQLDDKTFQIKEIIEKPGQKATPSKFASIGGYLLTPDILPLVAEEQVGVSGELNLSETISRFAQQTEVYGHFIDGHYHDTGTPELYLQAVVDVALHDAKLGPDFRKYLRDLAL